MLMTEYACRGRNSIDTHPPYRTLGHSGPKEVAASQHEVVCPHFTRLVSEGAEVGVGVVEAFVGSPTSAAASVGSEATSSIAVADNFGVSSDGLAADGDGLSVSVAVGIGSTLGVTNFSAKSAES
jgi:hypothetical protein